MRVKYNFETKAGAVVIGIHERIPPVRDIELVELFQRIDGQVRWIEVRVRGGSDYLIINEDGSGLWQSNRGGEVRRLVP